MNGERWQIRSSLTVGIVNLLKSILKSKILIRYQFKIANSFSIIF